MATRTLLGRAQKRILHDYKDIVKDPSQYFTAAPREDNLFEWVCLYDIFNNI